MTSKSDADSNTTYEPKRSDTMRKIGWRENQQSLRTCSSNVFPILVNRRDNNDLFTTIPKDSTPEVPADLRMSDFL